MKTKLESRIDTIFNLYFAAPDAAPRHVSVLHLARRDAAQCFGYDPNTYSVSKNPKPIEDGRQILWPGAMTLFAGVDLLGKHFAGTDAEQTPAGTTPTDQWRYSSGGRLKKFIEIYLTNKADEIETLYQLRCALDHSFALWARRRSNNIVYSFTLDRSGAGTLLKIKTDANGDKDAIVFLYDLHSMFEKAVLAFEPDYRRQLENSAPAQKQFEDLVDRYGFIGIATASTFGW
ncbi:MAG: hypothetical protein SFY67_11975 [Candidatus Melainabacteria bacterium]|nr:hypothetical protein [Candidatus Melainabacteria bacterium]